MTQVQSLETVRRMAAPATSSPDTALIQSQNRDALVAVLERLTPREDIILRARLGLGVPKLTLRELGVQFGVTPARIRQVEARAAKKACVFLAET
jgi:RNA polymerase sigma factor (sigma-70 family)